MRLNRFYISHLYTNYIIKIFMVFDILTFFSTKLMVYPTIKSHFHKSTKIFFGIVSIENSWYKRQVMYDAWIREIVRKGHEYMYCTQNKIESQYNWIPVQNWTISPKKFTADIDRQQKRITLAHYFIEHTDCDYFINPTDDVFIDSSRINELALKLKNKYDTNKDLIMLGHCLYHCGIRKTFLQGGSGYIMTRIMAKQFVNLSGRWLKESKHFDDFEITRFLSYLNQKPKDNACSFMSGWGFPKLTKNNFDFRSLPNCTQYYEPYCNTSLFRMDDLYIIHPNIHDMRPCLKIWKNFKRMINDKEHHYGWWVNHGCKIKMCKFN